jgi:heptosyltransferase II
MKILLVQNSFLGDTILSTPVIKGLHRIFPGTELWMMTTPQSACLAEGDPLLEGVIPFDKRKNNAGILGILKIAEKLKSMGFDRAYSLHRSFRTALLLQLSGIPVRIGFEDATLSGLYTRLRTRRMAQHEVIRNLSLLTGDIDLRFLDTDLRLFAPGKGDVNQGVLDVLPPTGQYVLIVPGSVWPTKMWAWEGYRETVRYLRTKAIPVVLDGSPDDHDLLDRIGENLDVVNTAGLSNISDALYIAKNARAVVCNDSMALHMASAFNTPTVAVFCATSPVSGFYPWKNPSAVVVGKEDLDCRPCGRHGGKKCPKGTMACIKELSSDEVIQAVERVLRDRL